MNSTRPLSIPHLVFGLIFTGGALVWLIGEATHADLPHSAIGFPAVLIGAGIAGLIATLVNARSRTRAAATADESDVDDTDVEDTEVADTEVADTEPTTVLEGEDR